MGNDSSTQQPQLSLQNVLLANFLKSYQIYQHPNYPIIKNPSHDGKLTLFKKVPQNLNQQKPLILLNHHTVSKPKTVPQIDNFKALITYYNKRMQLTHENQNQHSGTQSNIVRLLQFSIKNQTTNQFIFPQTDPSNKMQKNKSNSTKMPTCGFKQIFGHDQKQPSINSQKRNIYSISFLHQFYGDSLQNQIKFRSQNGQFFREKQIWSIVYCCCKAAQKMLKNGLKEPILSPSAIFITQDCEIKVGQWQFISYYFPSEQSHKNSIFQEQGQTFISNDLQMTLSKQKNGQNQDIFIKYYWPPEGLVQIQNILRLGELQTKEQKLCEAKNSQVFCLAMTILQMLTLKPYYQKTTYSEKQLTKLIEQAIQIRQSEFQPMSQEIVDLLLQMLQWDPSQRFRFSDIVEYIHHVFETNEDIFRESVNFEGKSSRTNKLSEMSNYKTDRRETGSLATQISVDPFFLKPRESIRDEITHRQQGIIKNINFTVSLQHSQQIKQKDDLILIEHEINQKKDCLLDSGVISQGNGDDYNPALSDEEKQGQDSQRQRKFYKNYSGFIKQKILSPIQPDLPDYGQSMNHQMEEGEQYESPDEDIDYQPRDMSQNFNQNHLLSSKQFFQKPFTLIQNISSSGQFTVNQYVPMDWKQSDSNIQGSQRSPSLNESLNSMRSFDLKFLNRSNEEYNKMKKNIKIQESPQISIKPLQLKNFSSIIKETSSRLPSAKVENQLSQLCSPYQKQTDNIFTSPNIMEMIRQFTKRQSQQTPDFQNIQLPSTQPTFYGSTSQLSKKLSFKQSSPENQNTFTQQENQNTFKSSFAETFNSQAFSLVNNQTIQGKVFQSNQKKEEIAKQQFSKGWYQGAKKNGARNGYGTFYYKQGGKYSGYWYNNKMDGHGTLYYPDGRVAYQGQWQTDSLHGKGILINEKPKIIESSYDYRSFEKCQNEEYWTSYDGWFQNDQKSGYGQLLLSNNQKYVGEFKNDMVHGRGKFYKMDGTVFQGLWQNNQLVSKF